MSELRARAGATAKRLLQDNQKHVGQPASAFPSIPTPAESSLVTGNKFVANRGWVDMCQLRPRSVLYFSISAFRFAEVLMTTDWLGALAVTMGLGLYALGAQAAEINCVYRSGENSRDAAIYNGSPSGTCLRALIKGRIVEGDAEQFTKFVRDNHPYLDAVDLWSSGGQIVDAIQIGLLVRKEMLLTRAPNYFGTQSEAEQGNIETEQGNGIIGKLPGICEGTGCVCYSSCFIIWSAGVERTGTVVGFHRPTVTGKEFQNAPGEEAVSKYRELLSALRAYFLEMEIPFGIIEAMLGVSSAERVLRIPDDVAYDLRAAPSISEWIAASCGSLTRREWVINSSPTPSMYFEGLVREIQRKAANIAQCSWKKRLAHRQTIAAP